MLRLVPRAEPALGRLQDLEGIVHPPSPASLCEAVKVLPDGILSPTAPQ